MFNVIYKISTKVIYALIQVSHRTRQLVFSLELH